MSGVVCMCVCFGVTQFFCYDVILSVPKIKVLERTGQTTENTKVAIVKAKIGVSDVKKIICQKSIQNKN